MEDVHREGQEQKEPEDHSKEPDINSEDNAIEMSEQFDGKTHDIDDEGGRLFGVNIFSISLWVWVTLIFAMQTF